MRSAEYPKTENLLERDPDSHKLILGRFRRPEFNQIKTWHVTEKIDGTNMRLLYAPETGEVEVRGRSDRANIPGDLRQHMLDLSGQIALSAAFTDFLAPRGDRTEWGTVTIFGEGYGPGIQQGGGYGPEKRFRMFDVMYHWPDGRDSWCQPTTVEWLSGLTGIPMAPLIAHAATMDDVFDIMRTHTLSTAALENGGDPMKESEGIIARTDPYLYNERGQRVMFKLKGADLEPAV